MTRPAVLIILLAFVLGTSGAQATGPVPMQGRLLTEIIAEYQEQGIEILYSSGLVRPLQRVPAEPGAGEPIQRLRSALESIGLTLKQGSSGGWRIVRHSQSSNRRVLTGRVLDAHSGAPLTGVNVQIDGQTMTTDDEGRFFITVDPTRATSHDYSRTETPSRRCWKSP